MQRAFSPLASELGTPGPLTTLQLYIPDPFNNEELHMVVGKDQLKWTMLP